jgi:glycosyltransferase involved in cell wall biosynthesis
MVLALFGSAPRRPRLYQPATPTVVQDALLAIDFTNPLQRASVEIDCPRWPYYVGVPGQLRCSQGLRILARERSNELPLRFPLQPSPGDELVIELTVEGQGARVKLFAWDALHQTRVPLASRKRGPGRHRLRVALTDAVRNCYADRHGFQALLALRGSAIVHRADYLLGGGRPCPIVPWVYLPPGHQVFAQRCSGYVRSWGFVALEGGRLPLPRELDEPPPSGIPPVPPPPDLLSDLAAPPGKKRADNLLFLIEQEFAAHARRGVQIAAARLQVVQNYHKVITHRGKRVLIISHLYPSQSQPGLGPFVHEQVSALRVNSGIDARVVCCTPFWFNTLHPVKIARAYRAYRKLFANLRWQSHDGVPVLYLPYMVGGFFRHWLHSLTYGNAIQTASDWLREQFDFEIIHAHTSYLDGCAALALARKFAVPYLLTEHTGPFHLLTDNPLKRRRTVTALTHARKVFCVSGALADDVRGVLPAEQHGKIDVLHNGVDTAQFYPPPRWTPDPARPRFLSVISLDDNKNPLMLLDAFHRLRAEVPGARLAIVGDGPLRDALHEKIDQDGLRDAVALLGFKTRSEVARLMRDECDALVLPSNSETFGVVLIEALACGKPIVATDCGGPRDIVTDPALGVLCRPRDAQALYEGLRTVAGGLDRYRGEEIRRRALENYDYYNLASRLAEEYDRLTA